jgi:hypothetical protein
MRDKSELSNEAFADSPNQIKQVKVIEQKYEERKSQCML